jgi:small-conductance mechanosensitive channel
VLVRRNHSRLDGWRPEGRVDDLVRAGLLPALPLLPITVVCGALAALHLVPDGLLRLYRFSAVAPPLAAATIGVSYELFPVAGGAGLSAQLAGYYRRLIRLLAILAALLSLAIDLLPTLGYPEPAEDLVRAVLAGVLLLGWLAVALRKEEMLAIFGISGSAPKGPLQAGVARYYRIIALGPVLLWFLDAVGYENLARLLARGGLVTLCVALLAPWFYVRLTGLLGYLVGYPDGGGLLALGADTSKAAYRALAPLVLVGVGGVSALLVASGWDYEDNLIDNLVGSATYTLVRLGGSEVTPASLGLLALTAALTVLATRTITGALERNVYPLYDLDRATQATMTALVRYSSWGVGTLVGLKVVGFGAAVLGVVASVVGIGVGFGSQTIASNFIAGLMLLMTRRISVDDVIEVDGLVGRVVRISSYSTVVRTLDNLKVIVPNAKLIDSQVVNWTVDDHKVRLQIAVGVAYGSDVRRVRRLLMQACEADAKVLGWPKPMVRFDDFADSALLFTVLPWIDDPDDRFVVASNLRFAIDELFREHGVEIAFPQQDIHLRTGDGVLQVQWQGPEPAPE